MEDQTLLHGAEEGRHEKDQALVFIVALLLLSCPAPALGLKAVQGGLVVVAADPQRLQPHVVLDLLLHCHLPAEAADAVKVDLLVATVTGVVLGQFSVLSEIPVDVHRLGVAVGRGIDGEPCVRIVVAHPLVAAPLSVLLGLGRHDPQLELLQSFLLPAVLAARGDLEPLLDVTQADLLGERPLPELSVQYVDPGVLGVDQAARLGEALVRRLAEQISPASYGGASGGVLQNRHHAGHHRRVQSGVELRLHLHGAGGQLHRWLVQETMEDPRLHQQRVQQNPHLLAHERLRVAQRDDVVFAGVVIRRRRTAIGVGFDLALQVPRGEQFAAEFIYGGDDLVRVDLLEFCHVGSVQLNFAATMAKGTGDFPSRVSLWMSTSQCLA